MTVKSSAEINNFGRNSCSEDLQPSKRKVDLSEGAKIHKKLRNSLLSTQSKRCVLDGKREETKGLNQSSGCELQTIFYLCITKND
jgi:hypothetical protein